MKTILQEKAAIHCIIDILVHIFIPMLQVWNPSVLQEFVMCTERVCLLSWSFCWRLLFFLHRHDDVTPSWFRALESYVLRVPVGNEIKLSSSPSLLVFTIFVVSSLFTPSLLV